jgi:hypothetical protein
MLTIKGFWMSDQKKIELAEKLLELFLLSAPAE